MKSLAIEREFGSGGREIGTKISKKLGIPCYDGQLIIKAAEDYGVELDLLKKYDETTTGSLLYSLALISNLQGYEHMSKYNEMFYAIQQTIKKLEMQGPAIFIGRCCTEILQPEHTKKVFIYASNELDRLSTIMKHENVDATQAVNIMKKKDKERTNYFRFWTNKDWKDWNNYDLCLNTSTHSIDECVRLLADEISNY
ncbi:MAG: cytidylate kinase-like family protein [Lachnospiraceae bacterium]|nr:cytidylate kinase-like family protein [Lachnospiraceae bacterium]